MMNSTASLSSLEKEFSAQFMVERGPLAPLLTSTTLYILAAVVAFIEYRGASANLPNSTNQNDGDGAMNSRGRRVMRSSSLKHEDSPLDGGREGSSSPFASNAASSPSFKSNGETSRRKFYAYLLFSLILRIFFLPLGYFFTDTEQITSIVSWTLPSLSSAIAYSILILFYAQVVATSVGRASSFVKYEGLIVKGAYITYAAIVALNCVIPVLSGKFLLLTLWGVLSGTYFTLFLSMIINVLQMMNLLKGNMNAALGCRLVTMSTICCVAFMIRSFIYGMEAYAGYMGGVKLFPDVSFWNGVFGRTVLGYLMLEWFPALVALALMHRKEKQVPAAEQSDSAFMQLESGVGMGSAIGQLSPLLDSVQSSNTEGVAVISGGSGVKRSMSVNGGLRKPSILPQNQNQQRMLGPSSSGGKVMSRSMSGGRPETNSLLGDKSQSAQASSSNPSLYLYGAMNQ
mmetsp:Transcript_13318/g.19943  ORF Transcript_13318/g.19943 Transcript_13318/m.19943 type:complete len:457 (-) Transcript_13318:44-1414(-)